MKMEKLTEEMAEKIVGGSKRKVKTVTRKLIEMPLVQCIRCGDDFKILVTYNRPLRMTFEEYFRKQDIRRTCPHCGFVNSQYEVFR